MGLIGDVLGSNAEETFNQATPDIRNLQRDVTSQIPNVNVNASDLNIPDFSMKPIQDTFGNTIGQFTDAGQSAINELGNTGKNIERDLDQFSSGIKPSFNVPELVPSNFNTDEVVPELPDLNSLQTPDIGKLNFGDVSDDIGQGYNDVVTGVESGIGNILPKNIVPKDLKIPQIGNIVPKTGNLLPDVGKVELPEIPGVTQNKKNRDSMLMSLIAVGFIGGVAYVLYRKVY